MGNTITKNISWWRTDFGEDEIRRIADSIHNEHISQGPVTAEFEHAIGEVLGVPYVAATTSGSMALFMALIVAGVKPGDEVIVPNRTWIATANAPLLLGAKVVLVDVEKDLPIIDVDRIEEKITPRTKAIIPVHLNGRSANMRSINQIALKHGLKVIEDSAQAFSSRNADGMLGCQSFAGCFSLSVAKIISSGQGGFVVTKDKSVHERLKAIRTHGVSDLIDVSYNSMGFNFRFNDIQASLGIVQLSRLKEKITRIKAIYQKYQAAMEQFSFLKFIPVDVKAGQLPIYIEVLCSKRDRLRKFLSAQGIQTRPFYPDLNLAAQVKY